jgi:DNA primase
MWRASVSIDGTPGAAYLESRSIPSDVAHEAGVRFSTDWYGRPSVLFPMYNKAGNLIAVNGRFIDGRTNPKTQTAGPKSLGVFATPGALSAPLVAVCEGPMDALSLWLCGIAAVALVGTSAPDWLPSSFAFKSVLLATDADGPGDDAASHLTPVLKQRGARVLRFRPRTGKDWNDSLITRGSDPLRQQLSMFSEFVEDDERVNNACLLARNGRREVAAFVASLVGDPLMRELAREYISRKDPAVKVECVA